MSSATQTYNTNGNPYLQELGVTFGEIGDGRSVVRLELADRHMNSWQVAHGGVLMSLLDVAMAMAARSLHAELHGVVTVEMKTSFLQPGGIQGSQLEARGHAYHQTTTMCFCEAEIWNGHKLVAKGSGTFKYLRKLKSGGNLRNMCDSE